MPVRATFAGIKGIPLLALAHNSLFPDRIGYRVLIASRQPYAQIERIDASQLPLTHNVCFVWKHSALTFTANVRGKEMQLALLRFLHALGLPLTDRASALLETQ